MVMFTTLRDNPRLYTVVIYKWIGVTPLPSPPGVWALHQHNVHSNPTQCTLWSTTSKQA